MRTPRSVGFVASSFYTVKWRLVGLVSVQGKLTAAALKNQIHKCTHKYDTGEDHIGLL